MYICAWQAPELAPDAVDLLEDDRGFGDAQPAAAVFRGDQRREPAGVGQRLDELLGIRRLLFDLLPVLAVELRGTTRAWPGGIPRSRRRAG